ncbi:hypothetical protein AGMMS49921_03020 [Endomicrobiia bacterium]|nr:hypothetical protein AGMMS49921_03020 [Endomicrobiia bacterium]
MGAGGGEFVGVAEGFGSRGGGSSEGGGVGVVTGGGGKGFGFGKGSLVNEGRAIDNSTGMFDSFDGSAEMRSVLALVLATARMSGSTPLAAKAGAKTRTLSARSLTRVVI